MKIWLNNVRLAFPDIWEAKSVNGGPAAYGSSFLMDPGHEAIAMLKKGFETVAKEKWGDKAGAIYQQLKAGDKLCLHNGDAKADFAGFEGMMYVSARSSARPLVVDRDLSPLTRNDGKPYAGCYVNAVVELWAQDHKQYGKRINAQLVSMQFVKDGDRFSGGVQASVDDFKPIDMPADDKGAPATADSVFD